MWVLRSLQFPIITAAVDNIQLSAVEFYRVPYSFRFTYTTSPPLTTMPPPMKPAVLLLNWTASLNLRAPEQPKQQQALYVQ